METETKRGGREGEDEEILVQQVQTLRRPKHSALVLNLSRFRFSASRAQHNEDETKTTPFLGLDKTPSFRFFLLYCICKISGHSFPSIQFRKEICRLPIAMSGALSPNLTVALNHKSLTPATFRFPASIRFAGQFAAKPAVLARCSVEGDVESGNLKGALSNMVGERVEELLNKEENKELLDKLNAASERVEKARKELADIERQEMEAKVMKEYIQKMEARAAEIAECQREVEEAKAMVEEAELSLSMGADAGSGEEGSGEIDKEAERLESVKAASISALVGTLASLPITLVHANDLPQLVLPLSITFASCALFGVTFRYAVRRDLDNFQLKTGTAAAFGFVKGLATLNGGAPLELNTESFVAHGVNGALLVSQELVVFLFAAVGLDLCFKLRLLSPFPIRSSNAKIE